MNDLMSRDESSTSRAKIKTSFAKIIVEGTAEKPYYSILYYDTKRREYMNGYGSYKIGYVFKWLAEEFEIDKDAFRYDAEPVRHGRWIHCKGKSNLWYCSECGEKIIYNPTRKTYMPNKKPVHEVNKRCRNCGARMDAEENA